MPSSILQPKTYRFIAYGAPQRGRARVVVDSSLPIEVHALSTDSLEDFRNGAPFHSFGSSTAGPGNRVDALVQLPASDWYLVFVNNNQQPAAIYYEVYS